MIPRIGASEYESALSHHQHRHLRLVIGLFQVMKTTMTYLVSIYTRAKYFSLGLMGPFILRYKLTPMERRLTAFDTRQPCRQLPAPMAALMKVRWGGPPYAMATVTGLVSLKFSKTVSRRISHDIFIRGIRLSGYLQ